MNSARLVTVLRAKVEKCKEAKVFVRTAQATETEKKNLQAYLNLEIGILDEIIEMIEYPEALEVHAKENGVL